MCIIYLVAFPGSYFVLMVLAPEFKTGQETRMVGWSLVWFWAVLTLCWFGHGPVVDWRFSWVGGNLFVGCKAIGDPPKELVRTLLEPSKEPHSVKSPCRVSAAPLALLVLWHMGSSCFSVAKFFKAHLAHPLGLKSPLISEMSASREMLSMGLTQ